MACVRKGKEKERNGENSRNWLFFLFLVQVFSLPPISHPHPPINNFPCLLQHANVACRSILHLLLPNAPKRTSKYPPQVNPCTDGCVRKICLRGSCLFFMTLYLEALLVATSTSISNICTQEGGVP
ncbi:hypothetical protein F5X96DRAFT_237505 [Biscogniauxia mediterranea]|nr:hypothetical protein F5X96DRAFT_237505 [Biscogniauxia mediterranea]